MQKYGIGFLAAGPVAQSIHIPAVRRYPQQLSVSHIMDIDAGLAQKLGDLHGAKWTTSEDDLINDPNVHIVVVGSPNQHHARQVIKACEAGKKLVLAEKPLATSEQELAQIREAAEKSGTAIVVGAMHAFDTAYLEALAYWNSLSQTADSFEVVSYLSTNNEFVDLATQLLLPSETNAPVGGGPRPAPDPVVKVTNGILGLAMHDIPLIRDFNQAAPKLDFVHPMTGFGYLLQGLIGDATFRFIAQMGGKWAPGWTFRAVGTSASFEIDFQPSYVLAGSAKVRVTANGEVREYNNQLSAYGAEWEEIINIVAGGKPARYPISRIEDDSAFALAMIQQLPGLMYA